MSYQVTVCRPQVKKTKIDLSMCGRGSALGWSFVIELLSDKANEKYSGKS